jgi:hypothetical protein
MLEPVRKHYREIRDGCARRCGKRSGAVEVLVNKEVIEIGLRCEKLETMTVHTSRQYIDGT